MRRANTAWTPSDRLLATGLVVAMCGAASAQDYVVTRPESTYTAPPATGKEQPLLREDGLTNHGTRVDLPFAFTYFGRAYPTIWIATAGFIQMSPTGQYTRYDNEPFPVQAAEADGMIAPAWDENRRGTVWTWTTGAAPDRVFWVTWEDFKNNSNRMLSFQVRLHETSGRIVFAYASEGEGWPSASYSLGIDAVGESDERFVAPLGNSDNLGENPTQDFVFDASRTVISGTALYDQVVADEDGLASGLVEGVTLPRVRIEAFDDDGLVARFSTDESGRFSIPIAAAQADATADLRAAAVTPLATVRTTPSSVPTTIALASDVAVDADLALGALTADSAKDTGGLARRPFFIAQTIATIHAAVSDVVNAPHIEVLYDSSSSEPTGYQPEGQFNIATLRIAGSGAGDDDGWDRDEIARAYCRHLLDQVEATASTTPTAGFDTPTDDENAFAEALGAWLAEIVDGEPTFVNATDDNTGTSLDLESPDLQAAPGTDVAGWVAAMLHDVLDGSNETHDRIDGVAEGTLTVLELVAGMQSAPTTETFMQAWAADGREVAPLVRSYIHYEFIDDDSLEPNDDSGEPTEVNGAGDRLEGLVLTPYNDDWFTITLAEPTTSLGVDLSYDRLAITAEVAVEILQPDGATLAATTASGGAGPVSLRSAALPPGTYHVRIRHVSGDRIPDYSIQVFPALTIAAGAIPAWTVGRPLEHDLPVSGGLAPYRLSDSPVGSRPPGLVFIDDGTLIRGVPGTAGTYEFSILADDSGEPLHTASRAYQVIVNPPLKLQLDEFLALPAGRAIDMTHEHAGGTSPFHFQVTDGALPVGISMDADRLRFHGTAATPVMSRLTLMGTDIAGSTDQVTIGAVACAELSAKSTPAPLAAGPGATGYFVDAVAGSSLGIKVKTAKKQAKRNLVPLVLGPDGLGRTPAKIKGGRGKASISKLTADTTGRYYVLLVADDGGDSSELLASPKVKPGKKAKGKTEDLALGETFDIEVGALAGARLKLTLTPERKTDLEVTVLSITSPSGQVTTAGDDLKRKGSKVTLQRTLDASGSWIFRVRGQAGQPADVSWAFKIKQPKGVVYDAD